MYNTLNDLVDRDLIAPYNVELNRPPVLLQIPTMPGFEQFIPMITAVCCNYVSATRQDSQLRRLLYNSCVENNFNNGYFSRFVKNTMTLFEMRVANRSITVNQSTLVQDLIGCASFTADMHCIELSITVPNLETVIRQDTLYNARQARPALDNHVAMMNNYVASTQAQYQSAPAVPAMQNMQASRYAVAQNATDARAEYNRRIESMQTQVKPVAAVPVEQSVQKQVTPVANNGVLYAVENRGLFKPTFENNFDYVVNLNDSSNTVTYVREQNGAYKPVITPLMDKSKHFKSSIVPSSNLDIQTSYINNTRSAKTINSTSASKSSSINFVSDNFDSIERKYKMEFALKRDDTGQISKAFYPVLSDADVWLHTDVKLAIETAQKNKSPIFTNELVFATPTCLVSILPSMFDPKPLIDKIIEGEDFASAINIIKNFKARLEMTNMHYDSIKAINYILKLLTDELNRFIETRLCLPIHIDSFYDDAMDVLRLLDDKYKSLGTATRVAQYSILRYALQYSDSVMEELFVSQFIDADCAESPLVPSVTFFRRDCIYASTNLQSNELQIDLNPGKISSLIDPHHCSLIHDIAENMFKQDVIFDTPFSSYYLKTADNVVLEFSRSILDRSSLLLRVKSV